MKNLKNQKSKTPVHQKTLKVWKDKPWTRRYLQLIQRLASRLYKIHKGKQNKAKQNVEYIRKPIELYKWLSKYHRKKYIWSINKKYAQSFRNEWNSS